MAFHSTGTARLSWLTSFHAHPRGVGSRDDALQSADQMWVWQTSPCCIEDTHSHAYPAASQARLGGRTTRTRYQRTYGAFLQQSSENLALAGQTPTSPMVANEQRSHIPAITSGKAARQEWGVK
jgi:hypothetical protein